MASASHPG